MESLKPVAESIKLHLPQILHGWNAARECESWLRVPAEFRLNNIVGAIRGLVDAALDDGTGAAALDPAQTTAGPSEDDILIGFAEDINFAEYRLLQNALSGHIESNFPLPLAQQAIARLHASATLPLHSQQRR